MESKKTLWLAPSLDVLRVYCRGTFVGIEMIFMRLIRRLTPPARLETNVASISVRRISVLRMSGSAPSPMPLTLVAERREPSGGSTEDPQKPDGSRRSTTKKSRKLAALG